jgi:CheY-like chemotaxis protein
MSQIDLLVAVRREDASRFYKNLSAHKDFHVHLVMDADAALDALADRERHVDVLVLDNGLGQAFDLIDELRHTYPRLLIVLVDEEADFALPGQADEVSTDPFTNDDLIRRITRLMSDRQLETLRADTMPAVRSFAKHLRTASGEYGKQQAAVSACRSLGFDYVAFYQIETTSPLEVRLRAQDGDKMLQMAAPKEAAVDDIIGWVAKSWQTRTAGPNDSLNHPLVEHGRMGVVAAVPVGMAQHYGVLVACQADLAGLTSDNIVILELVSAQLAAALSKDSLN